MSVAASESVLATARRSVPNAVSNIHGLYNNTHTHNIRLSTDGYQPVDVLADRYKDLACHVTALFRSGRLILDVNARCSALNEELCQLHYGCKTPMPSVRIRNDRPQEVCVGNTTSLRFGGGNPLFTLLTVVEKLSEKQLMNLVRNSILILSVRFLHSS